MTTLTIVYLTGVIPSFFFTRYMWYKTYPEYKKDKQIFPDGLVWILYGLFSWLGFPLAFMAHITFKSPIDQRTYHIGVDPYESGNFKQDEDGLIVWEKDENGRWRVLK